MSDNRKKDTLWGIEPDEKGTYTFESVHLAILQDIRDELKDLNHLLRCQHFLKMPHQLRRIAIATEKLAKKKKPVKRRQGQP